MNPIPGILSVELGDKNELATEESKEAVLRPPKTWVDPDAHAIEAIGSNWYQTVYRIQGCN